MGKTYRVNDIFYSLQGEGRHTGRAAVFIRFSGCNLRCPFCDTDFDSFRQMTASEIIDAIAPWLHCGFVVLTGGEPSLQVDTELVNKLHDVGLFVAMETNGTHAIAEGVDWVTLSPKTSFVDHPPVCPDAIVGSPYLCLQPCDTGDPVVNRQLTARCVAYIKEHPEWHLSLQTHKIIGIE